MAADSLYERDPKKREAFFKKIDEMTKGFELKKETPNWFEMDGRVISPIIIPEEMTPEQKRDQLLDTKLYTIYKKVEGGWKPVAWNVPRVEKDTMLLTVFRPRLVRVIENDGCFESELSKFEAFPNGVSPVEAINESVYS